jgi:tRNA (mo5U34)-methyltransferase
VKAASRLSSAKVPGVPGEDDLDLATEVAERGPWYHTFDLPGGIATQGFFDLRTIPAKIGLPASLEGKRCLDAAACEGFWSFELARRGAAEVVSLDLPDTTEQDWQGNVDDDKLTLGTGLANSHFRFIKETLGHKNVERVDMNIYDVSPESLGQFDFVFVGNILVHLADPARALRALASALLPGGRLLSLEPISFTLTMLSPRIPLGQLWDVDDQPRWWTPNAAGHKRLLHAAGLRVVDGRAPFFQPFGEVMATGPTQPVSSLRDFLHWRVVRKVGVASSWLLAEPAS